MLRKKNEIAGRTTVPVARSSRKWDVSCGTASAKVAKKKALRPKAANGKAVAVPR